MATAQDKFVNSWQEPSFKTIVRKHTSGFMMMMTEHSCVFSKLYFFPCLVKTYEWWWKGWPDWMMTLKQSIVAAQKPKGIAIGRVGPQSPSYDLPITKIQNPLITKIRYEALLVSDQNAGHCHWEERTPFIKNLRFSPKAGSTNFSGLCPGYHLGHVKMLTDDEKIWWWVDNSSDDLIW